MKRSFLTVAATHTILVSLMLLSGCVGTQAPDTQYYLLRADTASATTLPMSNIHLSKVIIAPYLDQAGLVLEQQPGTIAIARYHQWSEPLSFSLKNFLSQTLSTHYGQEIITGARGVGIAQHQQGKILEITIDQLHGTAQGDVKLVASWTVQGREAKPAPIAYHKFSRTLPLNADGYPALVQTEKQLLTELAQAVVETLP